KRAMSAAWEFVAVVVVSPSRHSVDLPALAERDSVEHVSLGPAAFNRLLGHGLTQLGSIPISCHAKFGFDATAVYELRSHGIYGLELLEGLAGISFFAQEESPEEAKAVCELGGRSAEQRSLKGDSEVEEG